MFDEDGGERATTLGLNEDTLERKIHSADEWLRCGLSADLGRSGRWGGLIWTQTRPARLTILVSYVSGVSSFGSAGISQSLHPGP